MLVHYGNVGIGNRVSLSLFIRKHGVAWSLEQDVEQNINGIRKKFILGS